MNELVGRRDYLWLADHPAAHGDHRHVLPGVVVLRTADDYQVLLPCDVGKKPFAGKRHGEFREHKHIRAMGDGRPATSVGGVPLPVTAANAP